MRIRITQLDGKLPNLALLKLTHWHRSQGHEVTVTRRIERDLMEPEYDQVYASAIFAFSARRVEHFRREWPGALIGGTGTGTTFTVEDVIGVPTYEHYDYADVSWFRPSMGFTQRGCRLKCAFCVVPTKEGRNRSVNTIPEIWRGPGHDKDILLLDNDIFGQPEAEWRARFDEVREGGFRMCMMQGFNVRLISPAAAEVLATVEYRDWKFRERRLYTAWDNLRDERIFFRGIDALEAAGIPPRHVMAYMLVGFDPAETWTRIHERFDKMVSRGVMPYPMVYDTRDRGPDGQQQYQALKAFQRWAVTGLYRAVPWSEYDTTKRSRKLARQDRETIDLFPAAAPPLPHVPSSDTPVAPVATPRIATSTALS